MSISLDPKAIEAIRDQLFAGEAASISNFAGRVQPVHVVYGGADRFTAGTIEKLGNLAKRSLEDYAPDTDLFGRIFDLDPSVSERVYTLVRSRLETVAIEDYRIDFEDGYGIRSDLDEDQDAARTASETATAMQNGQIPPFFGIRTKAFSPECFSRAVKTLDLYLTALVRATGGVPDNFVVTLPKVTTAKQVSALAEVLDSLEQNLGLDNETIAIEIMVETPQSIVSPDGTFALPSMVAAARGRCRGAHFGAYDLTAALGITSQAQTLDHQACDFARNVLQTSLSSCGVWLSDGATTEMPVPLHRGSDLTADQMLENRDAVTGAWKLHYINCRRSLANGFYQGWDLHPAQIPARLAAIYSFFLNDLEAMSARLKSFVENATKASLVGSTFDDAATGQGLLNFFLRAINCGALSGSEALERTGLTLAQLQDGSFAKVIGR